MKIEIIAKDDKLIKMLKIKPISYKAAVMMAFEKIDNNSIVSSWKDSLVSSSSENSLKEHLDVPVHGCFTDQREKEITTDFNRVLENIWAIGGDRGWYYANWLWHLRGFIDKLFGGVGLRRGRTNSTIINPGDTLDFWRVMVADKLNMRLLLYAEMKLPGEAWLEMNITRKNGKTYFKQTATFRPRGLWGRLYWYSVLPLHHFIFNGMAENIISFTRIERK